MLGGHGGELVLQLLDLGIFVEDLVDLRSQFHLLSARSELKRGAGLVSELLCWGHAADHRHRAVALRYEDERRVGGEWEESERGTRATASV
jgi:hypothetical protein